MKYTIMGFSQKEAINLELDVVDLSLLRWFVDFRGARRNGRGVMASRTINDEVMFWVKYEAIIDDMPILKLNSKDSVYRRLKELSKKKILKHATVREAGTFSYYCLDEMYYKLIGEDTDVEDTEDNTEFTEMIKKFEKNICKLKPTSKNKFIDILKKHDLAFVSGIIELCANGTSFKYFETTFNDKVDSGIDTIAKLDVDIANFRREQEEKKIAALKEKDNISKPVEEAKEKLEEIKDTKIKVEEIIEKDDIEIIKDVIKPKLKAVEFKAWIENLKVLKDKNKILIVAGSEFARNKVQKVYEHYIIAALKEANITYDFIEYKVEE